MRTIGVACLTVLALASAAPAQGARLDSCGDRQTIQSAAVDLSDLPGASGLVVARVEHRRAAACDLTWTRLTVSRTPPVCVDDLGVVPALCRIRVTLRIEPSTGAGRSIRRTVDLRAGTTIATPRLSSSLRSRAVVTVTDAGGAPAAVTATAFA